MSPSVSVMSWWPPPLVAGSRTRMVADGDLLLADEDVLDQPTLGPSALGQTTIATW
jgi:hypothetical protein